MVLVLYILGLSTFISNTLWSLHQLNFMLLPSASCCNRID